MGIIPQIKLYAGRNFVKTVKNKKMDPLSLTIQVHPDILLALNQSPDEFGKELKLWAAVSLYRYNKLSLARAATLAGYHRFDFEKLLAKFNIPISNLTIEDAKSDIEKLR